MSISASCLLSMGVAPTVAQPAPEPPISTAQMLARLSSLGPIQQTVLPRDEGLRSIRVYLSIPKGPPPASGWPVLYMLDGNASLLAIANDKARHQNGATVSGSDGPSTPAGVAAGHAVLVAIGYDIDARLDVDTRSWDYTPPLPGSGAGGTPDPRRSQRRNGGADALLDLIAHRVKPWVQAAAPINPQQQYLYGHSYGGLFTLYALATRPALFQHYIAASPSLWWHAPYITDKLEQLALSGCTAGAISLDLMVGETEVLGKQASPHARPRSDVQQLAQALDDKACLSVRYTAFPGLGHGPMLPASAIAAAQIAGKASLKQNNDHGPRKNQ